MSGPGTLLKSVVFDVKDGNEDRDNLSDPAHYGLENTANIYFPPLNPAADSDRIAGWFIRCSVQIWTLVATLLTASAGLWRPRAPQCPWPGLRATRVPRPGAPACWAWPSWGRRTASSSCSTATPRSGPVPVTA